MKQNVLLACGAACVLTAALAGGTLAAGIWQSPALENPVDVPSVAVAIQVENENAALVRPEALPLCSGQTDKPQYRAVNSGPWPEYIVVTARKYWSEAEPTVEAARASGPQEADNSLITFLLGDTAADWIVLSETENQVELLYRRPVPAGGKTPVALQGITLDRDLRGATGRSVCVDVTAYSVQYVEGEPLLNADAVTTATGVPVLVAGDGTVTVV